mmetsp:Transcript_7548/g.14298  ORF Transcript_7548/g.14298 Transcript_7548/m.14298 type:complete len:149 (+) Transcript_7548:1981-2427(+)
MNNQVPEPTHESLSNNDGADTSRDSANENLSARTGTVTITRTAASVTTGEDVLPLTLRARPHVTWDENVEDNEGLGRKSSKRCCIFHKQRDFGESSTDSSGDSDDSESSSSSGGGFPRQRMRKSGKQKTRIARPKQGKKVPDYQLYHA